MSTTPTSEDEPLADHLLKNAVNPDPRVSKVLSDHFWDDQGRDELDDLSLYISRIIVSLSMGYSKSAYKPELDKILDAYGKSRIGKIMPLQNYAFDGDRVLVMQRFISETMHIK